MNHKPNTPKISEVGKTPRPSLQTGVEQSDTKEIALLAGGLIVLTLGLGGLFMYSADEPLVATASQKASKEVSSFEMAKAFANPSPAPEIPVSNESTSPVTTEPSLQLVSNDPTQATSNRRHGCPFRIGSLGPLE